MYVIDLDLKIKNKQYQIGRILLKRNKCRKHLN